MDTQTDEQTHRRTNNRLLLSSNASFTDLSPCTISITSPFRTYSLVLGSRPLTMSPRCSLGQPPLFSLSFTFFPALTLSLAFSTVVRPQGSPHSKSGKPPLELIDCLGCVCTAPHPGVHWQSRKMTHQPGYQKALECRNSIQRPKGFCEANVVNSFAVL